MRFVGLNETFDSRNFDSMGHRVFEFDYKRRDYFYTYHPVWDEVVCEYVISVNHRRYHIPASTYILIGYIGGETDWVMVDEMINTDVEVLQLTNDFNSVSLHEAKLVSVEQTNVYMPSTKNPIPISDVTGEKTIVIAATDMYHKLKDFEIQDFCAMGD